jgi:uncharacterized protein (TIGR02266 family)
VEKRSKNRHIRRLPVQYGKTAYDHEAFSSNLSPTGLFLRTMAAFPSGTRVQVRLTLPDGRALELAGTIMWARKTAPQLAESMKSGMGVRLDQSSPAYVVYLEFVKGIGG